MPFSSRIIYLAILFLGMVSCNPIQDEVQHLVASPIPVVASNAYLQKQYSSDFETINLDSIRHYSELLKIAEPLSCAEKTIGIQFHQNDTLYQLNGWFRCPTSGEISCYSGVSRIYIKNDSLLSHASSTDKKVHISELGNTIKNISQKDYLFQHGKNKLRPALVAVFIEDRFPITTTKEVLKEIVLQFHKINTDKGSDYFQYNILFEGHSFLDIPPPPPPPERANLW